MLFLLAGLIGIPALRLYTVSKYRARIVPVHEAPAGRVAIVFGAGVLPNGEPSAVLYDRVATAAELYQRGKVTSIVLSGDGSGRYHDEPESMRRAALRLGVPDGALVLDRAGLRTEETCRRARAIFDITSATLVTQGFHLSRALMLCESFGLDVVGVASDRRSYSWRWRVSWQAREAAATTVAWLEIAARRAIRRSPTS
jgi:SanA protein